MHKVLSELGIDGFHDSSVKQSPPRTPERRLTPDMLPGRAVLGGLRICDVRDRARTGTPAHRQRGGQAGAIRRRPTARLM